MSLRKKLVSNLFYNFLDMVVLSITGYIFWVVLGKMLPPAEYGIVSTITSIALFLTMFTSLGFGGAIPKFIPKYLAENNSEKIKHLLMFSIKVSLIVSAVTGLIIYIFSSDIANFVYFDSNMIIPLQFLLPLLIFGTFSGILRSGLIGFQKFKQIFISDTVARTFCTILLLLFSLVFINTDLGIFAFLSISIVGMIFFGYYLYKIVPVGNKNGVNKSYISYGLASSFQGMMNYFIGSGGLILLGIIGTMEGVGFFRVVVLFGMFVGLPSTIIVYSFVSNIAELWSLNHIDKLRRIIQFSIKYTLILILPIVIFLTMFSRFFILLFFTSNYLPAAELFLPYLLGTLLYSLSSIIWNILYYTNEARYLLKITAICSVFGIILSLLLIPIYSTAGAAYAFLIPQLIFFPISLYKINKKINMSIKSIYGVIFASLIFCIISYLISFTDSVITTVLMVVLGVFYIFLLLKFKVFGKEDIEVIDTLPSFGPIGKIKRMGIKIIERNM